MKATRLRSTFLVAAILLSMLALFLIVNIDQPKACYGGRCFLLTKAVTADEKRVGLSSTERLLPNEGMIFIYEREDFHRFWMKDMKFPLDIVWLNSNNEIVHIERSLKPCALGCPSYGPNEKALSVIEINAGEAERAGMAIGKKFELRL